jgi:hypothetical protein
VRINGNAGKQGLRNTVEPSSTPTSIVSRAEKVAGTVLLTEVRATSWPFTFSATRAGESCWAPAMVVVTSMRRCLPAAILLIERAV